MNNSFPRRLTIAAASACAIVTLCACGSSTPASVSGPVPAPTAVSEPGPSGPAATLAAPAISGQPAGNASAAPALGGQLAANASLGSPSEGDKEFPGDADLTNPVARSYNDRTVLATIVANQGLGLRDGWFHGTDSWSLASDSGVPVAGPRSVVQVNGYAPGFVISYQLYDATQKATGFWIGAKFASPAAGTNNWTCFVYDGNPTDDGEATNASPYTCSWSDVRGWYPRPVLTIDRGQVVTNKTAAKQLMLKYCNDEDAAQRCHFTDFGYDRAVVGPHTIVGNTVRNDGGHTAEYTIGWEDESKASDTFGLEVSTKIELWEIWTTSITFKYEHTWEKSHSFKQDTQISVASKSVGWIEFAPNMQISTGTWVIDAGSDGVFLLPQVGISGPVADGGSILLKGCPIADYKNGKCPAALTTTVVAN